MERTPTPRERIPSAEALSRVERDPNNFATKIASKLIGVFGLPHGAFSAIAVYAENGETKRVSKELDAAMAEQFTNFRWIVDEINGIGPRTSKDPREHYEGNIDDIIAKTTEDLESFRQVVAELEQHFSESGNKQAHCILSDYAQVYEILLKELELKKRGYALVVDYRGLEKRSRADQQLEIKCLPGGNIVVLRGYAHTEEWQKNFGDSREKEFGLAQIYSKTKYIAIEGFSDYRPGKSLSKQWSHEESQGGSYDRIMKELINARFDGTFLELDARFTGQRRWEEFNVKAITRADAAILFAYVQRHNPELAERIGTVERYREFFNKQRVHELKNRASDAGLRTVSIGTTISNTAAVNSNLQTSSVPTGFELGQMAFSDALSVIKILIMNKAMNEGTLDRGIIVDLQGADHLSLKSYFFDNPQYAMDVVLTNVHEIIISKPGISNFNEVLERLQHMDVATWRWVFEFIGTIPFAKVAEPTAEKYDVEVGPHQRPMHDLEPYSAVAHMIKGQKDQVHSTRLAARPQRKVWKPLVSE